MHPVYATAPVPGEDRRRLTEDTNATEGWHTGLVAGLKVRPLYAQGGYPENVAPVRFERDYEARGEISASISSPESLAAVFRSKAVCRSIQIGGAHNSTARRTSTSACSQSDRASPRPSGRDCDSA